MRSPTALWRSPDLTGRALALLGTLAAALVVALVVAPGRLAASSAGVGFAGERGLTEAFRQAFVEYWRSGDRDLTPTMAGIVDYWFDFHVVKASVAAALLVVFAVIDVLLWRVYRRIDGPGLLGRAAAATAGVAAALCGVLSLLVVMANLQGAWAPFASLFPLLVTGPADPELAATLDQARQGLAGPSSPGHPIPPALDVMIDGFSRYHVVMAESAVVVAVALAGVSVACWRWFARTGPADRTARRVSGASGVLSAVSVLLVAVLALANATTAADSAPALLALLDGGW